MQLTLTTGRMRKLFSVLALSLPALQGVAQTAPPALVATPFGQLHAAAWAILQQQLKLPAHHSLAKTTNVAERLVSVTFPNGAGSQFYYSGMHGSALDNLTMAGYDEATTLYPTGGGITNNVTSGGRKKYLLCDSANVYGSAAYYLYNTDNQLVRYSNGSSGAGQAMDSFTYDAAGHLAGSAYYDASGLSYQAFYYYDAAGRPLKDTTYSLTGASTPQLTTYAYDGAGNCLKMVAGTDSTLYTYDAANRVTAARHYGNNSVPGFEEIIIDSFTYAPTGPIPTSVYLINQLNGVGGVSRNTVYANAAQTHIDSVLSEHEDSGMWVPDSKYDYLYNSLDHITYANQAYYGGSVPGSFSTQYFYESYDPTAITDAIPVAAAKLYPNPTTGLLHIAAPEGVQATVCGMDGRVLLRPGSAATIDLSPLPTGLYLVQLHNAQGLTAIYKLARR